MTEREALAAAASRLLKLYEAGGTLSPIANADGRDTSDHEAAVWHSLRAALSATAEPAPAEPVLTVAGDPNNPKFAEVFVGPPAFTKTVKLKAGSKLYVANK